MYPIEGPQNCKAKVVTVLGGTDTMTATIGNLKLHSQKLQTKQTKTVRIYMI